MSALPPIDQSLLPAEVRNGSAQDKKTYSAALGFEQTLVNELTKAMADTAKPVEADDTSDDSSGTSGGSDDTSSSQDSSTSMYMDMLPNQLSAGIVQNGGLGLARTFYDSMKEQAQ